MAHSANGDVSKNTYGKACCSAAALATGGWQYTVDKLESLLCALKLCACSNALLASMLLASMLLARHATVPHIADFKTQALGYTTVSSNTTGMSQKVTRAFAAEGAFTCPLGDTWRHIRSSVCFCFVFVCLFSLSPPLPPSWVHHLCTTAAEPTATTCGC